MEDALTPMHSRAPARKSIITKPGLGRVLFEFQSQSIQVDIFETESEN